MPGSEQAPVLMCFPLPGCVCFRHRHVLHLQMLWARSSADIKPCWSPRGDLHHLQLQPSPRLQAAGQGVWAEVPSQTTAVEDFQPGARPAPVPSAPAPPARAHVRGKDCGGLRACAYLGRERSEGEGGSVVTHSAPRCDTSDNFNFMPLLWL